jgi:transcriptional regulator with XRE-family HTH domain
MSPFSHFLHELRMRHGLRQNELAEQIGYEQSYISALEGGTKGPPTQDFLDRLQDVLGLSDEDARKLNAAATASQRKRVIDADLPQDVFWLVNRLWTTLPLLTPTQVRVINEVLGMPMAASDAWNEPRRRSRRQRNAEAQM